MATAEREKEFYDQYWERVQPYDVTGEIHVPTVSSNFSGKRALMCSCGSGGDAVRAAKQGAETHAFDISETAIRNALSFAEFNGVTVHAKVMDFHNLEYPDNYFDLIYGTAILHHIDCSVAGKEIYRVLKPGGVAYFKENSDRNPILRFLRRMFFGKPGGYQKQKFLFFKRTGTTDEYPLTEEEVSTLRDIFKGNLVLYNEQFYFFALLNFLVFKSAKLAKFFTGVDNLTVGLFPFLRKYSFTQEVFMKKK
ncbi:MAG: class I SAM-dependent methyltransferase [Chlorobiales bacterium]|nr:class I SAM-dependent methyltransferase [Chlorobiales bacterium]